MGGSSQPAKNELEGELDAMVIYIPPFDSA